MERLRLYGLTGGIGSGKSTVARMLRERGVPVIDADLLARQVVEPGQHAHADIAATWPAVIGADGRVDRKQLAATVFADATARARLEEITHPRIRERARALARQFEQDGHRLAFLEAALLAESGFHRELDGLLLVTADEETRVARVVARDGCTRAEVLARVRAQASDDDKRRIATHVIDNSDDQATTRAQVERLLEQLSTP